MVIKLTKKNKKEARTIKIIDSYIVRHRSNGLKGIMPDCNVFGAPELNFLYSEVYSCVINGQPWLALAGVGMFLEQLGKEIWIASQVHKSQLSGEFNSWEEVMSFLEERHREVENEKITYKDDIKPALKKCMSSKDLESIELLRDFIRNNFIHGNRVKVLDILQKHDVLPKKVPLTKVTIDKQQVEEVELHTTHPLVMKIGFKVIAKQVAPALLIYIFELFRKYHKGLAPYRDDKIKFSGHKCSHDV